MAKKQIKSVGRAVALRMKAKLPQVPLSPTPICRTCGKPM